MQFLLDLVYFKLYISIWDATTLHVGLVGICYSHVLTDIMLFYWGWLHQFGKVMGVMLHGSSLMLENNINHNMGPHLTA